MKKVLAVLVSLLLLCGMVPLSAISVAAAASGTTGDCTWSLDGTHLTISGEGEMGDYEWECGPWGTDITSVTIGDGVTVIGDYAFYFCESLTSLTISDSVTTIGVDAFSHCNALTSLTIPDNVTTIEPSAVFNCLDLTLVNIGDGVTSIGCYAFGSNYALTTIRLPLSLTEVDDWAFENCPELTDVYYPGSEEDRANISFGDDNDDLLNATWHYNFTGCLHVYSGVADLDCDLCGEVREIPTLEVGVDTTVTISRGGETADFLFTPTESGLYSFGSYGDGDTYGCIFDANGNELCSNDEGGENNQFYMEYDMEAGETYILRACYYYDDTTGSFPVRVMYLRDGYQYKRNADGTATIIDYRGEMPTTLAIPSTIDGYSVTSIGDSAFADRYSLTSVIIPDSVTTIGDVAFYECNNLETVRLPGNLTEVGYEAFEYCYDLTDVYYVGSPEDSSHITFGEYNDYLLDATWHYNFTGCFHSYSSLTDPDCDLCGEVREVPIIEAGVDTTVTITYGGEMVDFIFVPAETGLYSFGAYGDEDTYGYILDAHGNELDRNDDGGEDNQFLMKYEMAAGEVYILRARYYDDEITGSFPVRVDHKAIESITIDPLVIIESQQDEWGYYSVEDCSITVTYTDGTTEQGDGWDFDISTDAYALQEEQPWTVGNTYTVTATVLGVEVPFEVSIVPNPVVSVEVEPLSYVEYTHGYWTSDWDENDNYVEWYYYELDSEDLILTVTMLDGNVFSGSYYDVGDQLEEYTGIDPWTYGWSSNQWVDHSWSVDGSAADQTFSVTWVYHQLEIPVTIIETPIASIEVEDVVRIVGSGSWREDWNEMDEHVEWMYYDPTPETITVTLKDGTTASGSRDDIYGELGIWLEYTTDQSCDDPWGVGDHTATIYYGSFEAEYTVSVTESPIASIEIPPLTYMEGTNGYWEGYWDENDNYVENAWYRYDVSPWYLTYTVTLTDGTVYSGDWYDVREQLYGLFGDAVYNYDYTSDQSYDNQWGVGDHVATLTWLGQMVEYTVTITEPPIASIEVEDISIMEGTDGYVEDGQYYYENFHCNGVVTFKDGTTQTFDGDIEIDGHWYYVSTNAWDLQQEQPWTVGNTYTVTGTVMGVSDTFEVTIIPGPVASFTIEDMVMYEGLDSDGDGYGVYPPIAQVVMKDGSLGELVYGDLYYDGIYYGAYFNAWDMQYEEPWTAGNTYTVTATLIGVTTTFNVTILPHPIESIEVVQAPDKTVYGLGENLNLKGAVLRVCYTDGTYEDVAFEKYCSNTYYYTTVHLTKIDISTYVYFGACFDTLGSQNAEVELFDRVAQIPVVVQSSGIESITIREDADKSIVITAHNADGTTTDMKVLDIPYLNYWDDGICETTLVTDHGEYFARILTDDDSFTLGLYVDRTSWEDEEATCIWSNTIGASDWFAIIDFMLNSSWYFFPDEYSLAYNGEVTAENIDLMMELAMYVTSVSWGDYGYESSDGEGYGQGWYDYYVFDADVARAFLLDVFGIANFDLSLSQRYDAETNTIRVRDWIHMGDQPWFDVPSDIRYENGVWYVTVTSHGDTVSLRLNDDLKIVAAGIHADIPTVEPVVPAAKPGDANGDGRINNRDLGLLQQYLADWGVALDPDVMDLNNDGRVNNRDLGLLQQYLADWDVELK